MTKKLLLTILIVLFINSLNAQSIKGIILNSITNKPIHNVSIVTNLNTGTTSNILGKYQLNLKNIKTVTFSCLGYKAVILNLNELKKINYKIYLNEKVNELEEIQLNLAKINIDSILIRTQKSMKKNYASGAIKYNFYSRENTKLNFKKLELELEKSTLLSKKNRRLAEQEFINYANNLKNSNPNVSTEFFGTIKPQKVYSKKIKKHYNKNKIDSITGYSLLKNKKQITLKSAQSELQNIVLKHLNKDKTYRVSSGLFKIEDSLSMKEVLKETDSLDIDKKFNSYQPMYNFNSANIKSKFFFFKNQNNFFNTKYYRHNLEKNELLNTKLLYVIRFEPKKSKSKFSGKMYINPNDFTITKIEYEFAEGKRGQNLNLKWLLGIKVSENINKTTLFYEKNEEDKVYLSYFKETKGSYAYVHRPIKFKENSPTKNKVKFDIKIELDTHETREVLIDRITTLDKTKIKTGKEKEDYKKKHDFLTLNDYKKTSWQDRKLIIDYLKKYN
jgi:hypothetical protein